MGRLARSRCSMNPDRDKDREPDKASGLRVWRREAGAAAKREGRGGESWTVLGCARVRPVSYSVLVPSGRNEEL